jgi:hypothetical protein
VRGKKFYIYNSVSSISHKLKLFAAYNNCFLLLNTKKILLRAEVRKVTLKSNGDETLNDEFLLKSNSDEAFNDA